MSSQASLIAIFFGNDPNPTPLSPPRIISELPAPVAVFDGKTYTITIFRKNGTWLKDFFNEHVLSVCACREDELSSVERDKIRGPVAADDLLYYIRAIPQDAGPASFIWLESEEEAIAVAKAIQEADDAQWRQEMAEEDKKSCTFCGRVRSVCGEDHGDEMRDAQRAALMRH
jgi:hypothetical protein